MKRLLVVSGTAFVVSWIAGLFAVSGSLEPDDSGAIVIGYYVDRHAATMVQTALVDLVPGLALIGLTVALASVLRRPGAGERVRQPVIAAGLAAGVVSLAQFVVGETLVFHAKPAPTAPHGSCSYC